jgi:hypothetical protein
VLVSGADHFFAVVEMFKFFRLRDDLFSEVQKRSAADPGRRFRLIKYSAG